MRDNRVLEDYRARARSLEDDLGIDEHAWDQATAIEVVHALESGKTAVLGGDVYQEQGGVIRPAYANWSCERRNDESLAAYASRSRREALDFIKSFPEPLGAKTYYVLVLSNEETAGYL